MFKQILGGFLGIGMFICVGNPAQAQTFDWNGFYVGISGGVAMPTNQSLRDPVFGLPTASLNLDDDAIVGGQGGFNFQTGMFLFGVEGDVSALWSDSKQSCPVVTFGCETELNDLVTGRARLGLVLGSDNQFLFYATGGVAAASIEDRTVFRPGGPIAPSGTPINGSADRVVGWTAGGGFEAFWNQYVSFKAEYLFVGLPANNYTVDNGLIDRIRTDAHIARVGINLHLP